MNSLIKEFINDMSRAKFINEMNKYLNTKYFSEGSYPSINAYDSEDEIIIEALIPGCTKDDIDIDLQNNTLTISGEKKARESEKVNYIRAEREFGKFNRSIRIGIPIDTNNINAVYQNGILKITLKKAEEAKPKKIKIN